jgi:hypothetical protein
MQQVFTVLSGYMAVKRRNPLNKALQPTAPAPARASLPLPAEAHCGRSALSKAVIWPKDH